MAPPARIDAARRSPDLLHDARVAQLLARRKTGEDTREVLLALAVAFNVRNMPEDAKSAAAELLERDPADGEAWYEAIIAHSFGEPGEVEALVPRVDRLVSEHPLEGWTHRNQGLLRYYLERDEESRAACERALALDPQDSHAHEVLAYLAYTVGDMDAAIES